MKKFLSVIFVILLAYILAYYTSDSVKKNEQQSFDSGSFFYTLYCKITGTTDTSNAYQLALRADNYKDKALYDLALKDLEKAIQIDSTISSVYNQIGQVYLLKGDTLKALQFFKQYLGKVGEDPSVSVAIAEIYNAQGKSDAVINTFKSAIALIPHNDYLYFHFAGYYYKTNSFEEALSMINKAIDIDDQNNDYLDLRRKIYLKTGKYELAKADFDEILARDAYYFPNYTGDANTAYDKKEYRKAANYYTMALKIDPQNRENLENRGWSYIYLEKYDSAYIDFNKIVQLYPDYLSYFNRAYVVDYFDSIEVSIKDYDISTTFKDDYYLTYNNRGYEYYRLKKYKEAVRDYTKSIELKGDYYLSYFNRGLLYYDMEDYEKALSDFKNAISYNENNTNIIYDIALSYDNLDSSDQAVVFYNKYLSLSDKSDSIKRNYAYRRIGKLGIKEL